MPSNASEGVMFNMQMLHRSEPQNVMVVAAIASAGKLERALLTLSRQNALGRCTHLAMLDAYWLLWAIHFAYFVLVCSCGAHHS